jgi:hypothetical protein
MNAGFLSNPEGIVCQKCSNYTYNPFGIEAKCSVKSYKHAFPSGIYNSEKILNALLRINIKKP